MKAIQIADEALSEQRALSSKKHFEVLDGLRGVAALSVVLLHGFAEGSYHPLPNAELAVDMFFLLSGFVIAYSYDDKLRTTMSVGQFFARRFIRLYPMLLVGAAGGIAIALIHNKTNPSDAYPFWVIAVSGGLSLLVLPYLSTRAIDTHQIADATVNKEIFSFNPPIWSLFFELAANAIYAVSARRLSKGVLIAIVLCGLAGVVLGGQVGGGGKGDFWFGFPRVAFGFFGGILIYRLWREGKLPEINGNFLILSAVLLAVFAFPLTIASWAIVPAYAVLAAVIVCGVGSRASRFDKYCALLGQISYPVYLLHWLTLYFFAWLGKFVGFAGPRFYIVAIAHLLCVPAIAYIVMRYYETPVRLYLTRRYNRFLGARAAVSV